MHYHVPRAALALAQGFGRLIRHRGDRGVVALLDKRAVTKPYGRRVLAGLPPDCPRTARSTTCAASGRGRPCCRWWADAARGRLTVGGSDRDPRVIGVVAVAFLLGSIPFGVLLARARGVDLKKVGSGNIGATNAARALGKKVGLLVLLLDTCKAWLPTAAALWLRLGPEVAAVTGFAAFCGHIYSPWLKGRGGKGVACGLGAFLALAPASAGIAAAVCVLVVVVTRLGSLGSLAGSAALVPALWRLHQPRAYVILSAAMFVLILWRHRENIDRMLHRREHKL